MRLTLAVASANTEHMNSQPSLSSAVQQVIELFEDALEGVAFPDVDREVLQGRAERLASAQQIVAERQAALEAARAEVEQERAELQKLAGRALDYARIFAADDPALLERIEAIAPPGARPKRKRKAKRKKQAEGEPKADPQLALAKDEAAA